MNGEDATVAPRRWLRAAVKGAILTGVAGTLVFVWSIGPETWTHLRTVRWSLVALLPFIVGVAWVCNGVRTCLLAGALGHRLRLREALAITLSTEFAIAATPGGLGGLAVRLALQKRRGISRPDTLSMLAADVFADVLFFAALWPWGAAALWSLVKRTRLDESVEEWWTESAWEWGIAAGVALLAVAGLALWGRRRQSGRAEEWGQRMRLGLRQMVGNVGVFWRRGKLRLTASVLVAAVQWTCRYGVLVVAFWAFGVPVEPLPLMLLQGCLYLLALVVVVPGGGGSIELLSGVILPLLAAPAIVGPVVLLWRFCTYHLYILVGGVALWRVLRAEGSVRSV